MNLKPKSRARGIALIIVMLVIVFLGILAGGFAFSMKVETRLARNAALQPDLEWLGRSGVEKARHVLGLQMMITTEPYDSLDQKWAGGPGGTNEIMAGVSLENVELGPGQFSVKITDLERRFNINAADENVLRQALNIMGIDMAEASTVADSILDWRDLDNEARFNGAELADYQSASPPYACKNGPFDDISELLLVKGVTPAMYFGSQFGGATRTSFQSVRSRRFENLEDVSYPVGLAELFTTLSARQININTASEQVLQLIPGVDESMAAMIVQKRSEFPFQNVGELINIGLPPQAASQFGRFCHVRSSTFEVEVTASVGNYATRYLAVLKRNSPRDIQILSFHSE